MSCLTKDCPTVLMCWMIQPSASITTPNLTVLACDCSLTLTNNDHHNIINWFITAGTLRAAFTQNTRDDGSTYWCFTEQARQSVDDLTSFVRELHDDEMPNDWRYETIVDICTYLMDLVEPIDEQSDAHDIAFSAADSITSIYTSELCQWLGDNTGRLSYIDDAQEEA